MLRSLHVNTAATFTVESVDMLRSQHVNTAATCTVQRKCRHVA